MAQPYVGEIRIFAGTFAPLSWKLCNGELLSISEYETLFNLIGTTYGGDGQSTFALPDMRGRLPVHQGSGFTLGQSGGTEEVTLTVQQIPSHTHPVIASQSVANAASPGGNLLAVSSQIAEFNANTPDVNMNTASLTATGGSQPHSNLQPALCVNYIISLYGVFPSQT